MGRRAGRKGDPVGRGGRLRRSAPKACCAEGAVPAEGRSEKKDPRSGSFFSALSQGVELLLSVLPVVPSIVKQFLMVV